MYLAQCLAQSSHIINENLLYHQNTEKMWRWLEKLISITQICFFSSPSLEMQAQGCWDYGSVYGSLFGCYNYYDVTITGFKKWQRYKENSSVSHYSWGKKSKTKYSPTKREMK